VDIEIVLYLKIAYLWICGTDSDVSVDGIMRIMAGG
jgi:hypothetical protein